MKNKITCLLAGAALFGATANAEIALADGLSAYGYIDINAADTDQAGAAGDRTFDDTWTTTFLNDTDFMVRTAIELWMNGINDLADGTGTSTLADYQTDLQVEQLDRDDTILKTYIFRSAWPTTVAQIDLTSDQADAIEEFEVTWRYQHFEASGVNFG